MEGKEVLKFLILATIIGVLTFLLPQSIGLGAAGFDETIVLQQFSFYLVGGVFLVLLTFIFFTEQLIKEGDSKYGSGILFSSNGENPSFSFFKSLTTFQITLASIIIFSIIGIFTFVTKQTSFTGIGSVEQQFTPTAQLLFSTLLVPGAENLGLALVLASFLLGLRYYSRKYDLSKASFISLALFGGSLVGGIYWVINHLLRYSNQELAITTVFLFGLVMSVITVLTGSFLPAYLMHMSNNFFSSAQNLLSSDIVLVYSIGGIFLLCSLYFYLYLYKK
jgi:hypothetical protein